MGDIALRRRIEPSLGVEVYEVRLGEEYLMTSLFTASEVALATLGLAMLPGAGPLDVVVGGLGLGWTARTVLTDDRVGSVLVVDALDEVIRWHREDLVPGGAELAEDPRTRLVHGDFFAMAAGDGFDPDAPGRRFDAVLVDIDHTPDHTLHPDHGAFYTPDGLRDLSRFLRPGGVFGLWSDDPPTDAYLDVMREVLDDVGNEVVDFPNPVRAAGRRAASTWVVPERAASDGSPHRRKPWRFGRKPHGDKPLSGAIGSGSLSPAHQPHPFEGSSTARRSGTPARRTRRLACPVAPRPAPSSADCPPCCWPRPGRWPPRRRPPTPPQRPA